MSRPVWRLCASLPLVILTILPAWGDGPDSLQRSSEAAVDRKSSKDAPRRQRARGVTPEREAAALKFVEQHHPELSELLALLRQQSPRDYNRAIAELFRDSERLANLYERDLKRYQLELNLWKINSRIRLTTARITMGETPELRQELRELLLDQIDTRSALLAHERERVAQRLERMEKQLDQLRSRREELAERNLKQLLGQQSKAKASTQGAAPKDQ